MAIKTKILLRNDTKANWDEKNPQLGKGELGLEIDTGKFKFGDGVTLWSELNYANDIPEIDLSEAKNSYTEAETVEGLGEGKVIGDVGIVKTLIAGDKYSYTCYIWNGEDWRAADGNYNAENVYFDEDLITTSAIGNITLSGGQGTVAAAGKNLKDVWEAIFVKEDTDITVNKPTVTLTGSTSTQYIEVGSSKTATIGITYEDGSYEYGYTTEEGEAGQSAISVVNNGTTGASVTGYTLKHGTEEIAPTATGGNSFTVNSGVQSSKASYTVSGTAAYGQGYVPVSNLKKMYPAKRITAGTTDAKTAELFRWYIPMYHGFKYDENVIANPATVDASTIKGLTAVTGANAYNQTKPTGGTATKSWRQYFVAVPASYGASKPSAKDGNNIDCTVLAASDVTLSFNGVEVLYNVYYINNAAAYDTLKVVLTW